MCMVRRYHNTEVMLDDSQYGQTSTRCNPTFSFALHFMEEEPANQCQPYPIGQHEPACQGAQRNLQYVTRCSAHHSPSECFAVIENHRSHCFDCNDCAWGNSIMGLSLRVLLCSTNLFRLLGYAQYPFAFSTSSSSVYHSQKNRE